MCVGVGEEGKVIELILRFFSDISEMTGGSIGK